MKKGARPCAVIIVALYLVLFVLLLHTTYLGNNLMIFTLSVVVSVMMLIVFTVWVFYDFLQEIKRQNGSRKDNNDDRNQSK